MACLKYFAKIDAMLAADAGQRGRDGPQPLGVFDFESLASRSAATRAVTRFILRRVLPAVCYVLREVCPNPRFGRVVIVTRAADVRSVLKQTDAANVIYRKEMLDLGGGADNVLSLDGTTHEQMRELLDKVYRPEDVANVFESTRADTRALLDAGKGRIDVMRDLITRTATEVSCRLFGLTALDPDLFGKWTMAISNQLFGDYFADPNVHKQASIASAHLSSLVDDAIARVKANNSLHPNSARSHVTIIDRLVMETNLSSAQVRATIIGLVTAFTPTNTLAGGNMLEVLLERDDLMARAVEAAALDDRSTMEAVLLEAGRLNPALSPGLWRQIPPGTKPPVLSRGWLGRRRLKPNNLVLVCIPSALRDARGGEPDPWMMFGSGPHSCWGARLAIAHLAAVFIELLRREGLERAPGRKGQMFRTGPYPTRMDMTYRSSEAKRALVIITLPVRQGVERSSVESALDSLDNPCREDLAKKLTATNLVQFMSASVVEAAPGSTDSHLVIEINGDGDERELVKRIAEDCEIWLAPLLTYCKNDAEPIASSEELSAIMISGIRTLHRWPWGSTGLHFDGLGELSVRDIERQSRVARFALDVLEADMLSGVEFRSRAMDLLLRTRRLIKQDPFYALRSSLSPLMARGMEFGGAILKPSRRRLRIADWHPPEGRLTPLKRVMKAPDNALLRATPLSIWMISSLSIYVWLAQLDRSTVGKLMDIAVAALSGVLCTVVTITAAIAVLVLLLRRSEKREISDDTPATLAHVKEIASREDATGQAQNHIVAVMPFKSGLLRRLTFALAMWGILQSVLYWFRPGFVVTMGTIHKVRWFRIPGTAQFVFLSNYDGSWESYLEDFITRASPGQTAAWSHGVGFPPTRFLVLDGAADGDRFKRWVRRQQRPSRFWYSRFPNLTAQQIRNNAMIEDGIARATSDTDARHWLSTFGSAQREADQIETNEVQTIVFNGFSRQFDATAVMLRLPPDPEARGGWLRVVTGGHIASAGHPPTGLASWWVKGKVRGTIHLPPAARVRFGEQAFDDGGATIGLTARGLELLGLEGDSGLSELPPTFRMTMAARSALLGDEPGAPEQWRFNDDENSPQCVHAMFMIYGSEPGRSHADLVAKHTALLTHMGGNIVHLVPCSPMADEQGRPALDIEPFGFRDGISQPTIRGTRRAARPIPDRDMLAAGEFILGYRNQQGFVSPPLAVGPEHDPGCDLPTVSAPDSNRYPFFGDRHAQLQPRDFGRNGAFLAVRQLDQDVSGFNAQLQRVAANLSHSCPGIDELIGELPDEEWLGAKIVGRWRDGTPLAGNARNPMRRGTRDGEQNDFAFGADDPQGLACPLGAHIRRANPRDSQEPGDPFEQSITNRHRMIRRGRSYSYSPDGKTPVQGLLFLAVCSDLDRQFEFIQRTWVNTTSFHGLVDERDPLLGRDTSTKNGKAVFTVPTAAGPVRIHGLQSYVDARAGAYFFLPSRSSLAYLVGQTGRKAV